VINGPPWSSETAREAAKTERAAIRGWGPTLRLLTLRVVATTSPVTFTIVVMNAWQKLH
jgi:hypothetical protein